MKTKATMICPKDAGELVRLRHLLFSMDKDPTEDYVRVSNDKKLPILFVDLTLTERILVKRAMKLKSELVTVLG